MLNYMDQIIARFNTDEMEENKHHPLMLSIVDNAYKLIISNNAIMELLDIKYMDNDTIEEIIRIISSAIIEVIRK